MSSRKICTCILFCLWLWPQVAAAHKDDYLDETFVYQTMEKGTISLEYRSRYLDRSRDGLTGSYWNNNLSSEYGLTDSTMVESRLAWGTPESNSQFNGGFAQIRHRFGDEGEYFIDPAIAFEYESERENGKLNNRLTTMLVLSKDIGDFNMTFNYAQPFALNGGGTPRSQRSFGIRYPRHGIRWSIEYKDLAVDKRYILPAVQFSFAHDASLKLGIGKGINARSPRFLIAGLVEVEFGGDDE